MALLHEALTDRIIEADIRVHRELGPGYLESIYDKALQIALRNLGISFQSQMDIEIFFDNEPVGTHRLDLVVENKVVVELKAVKAFDDLHFAQVRSYLKATKLQLGLLLNFNAPTLTIKRVIVTQDESVRASGVDSP